MANDLLFQNISTVQNNSQPSPNTIASTTVIAPTTFLTYVSGTINVATITPPVTGQHLLMLSFTSATPGTILTTGNVLVGSTTLTQNGLVALVYDPARAKYLLAKLV